MKKSMRERRVIAAVMGTHMTCYRELLRGINAFANAHATWHLDVYSPIDNYARLMQISKPDGLLLGLINSIQEGAQAMAVAKHCVGVCGQHAPAGLHPIAEIESDDELVGEEAAKHFLQKGFTNFAFLGTNAVWSHLRWLGFERIVKQAGFEPAFLNKNPESTISGRGWATPHHTNEIITWIKTLPKPLAFLACNDLRGREVAEACRDDGIRVPDDVAILGVDNDDLDCEISHPPLSSIAIPWQRIGYEAATLLNRMLDGEKIEPKIYTVPPIGVIERQSTDTVAISDPEVAAAIRFIREHAHVQISVEDVLREVPAARRSLEKRFRTILGRSPLDEIRRVHIERAKQLLAKTDLAMPDIARSSGFGSAAWFSKAFHDMVGEAPVNYRRRYRKQ